MDILGNVRKKFFENYKIAARISGVGENLIRRFKITLTAISCGHTMDAKNIITL